MKITPCKKAKKPSLPPAKRTRNVRVEHLPGIVCGPIQEDLKSEITSWLKALHKDTAWLAEQCHVTPKTVDRWLMPWTHIPATREKRIRELMKEYPAPQQ